MTKIRNGTPGLGARRSIRGAFVIAGDPQKRLVASAWPRKRKQPPSSAQLASQAQFATVTQWIKMQDSDQVDAAYEGSAASPYLPRDLLMSTMYGRVVQVRTTGGLVLRGVRILSQSIQSMLDSITTDAGSILVRLPEGWAELDRGLPGQVLTSGGAGIIPFWANPASGSAINPTFFAVPSMSTLYVEAAAIATYGQIFKAYDNISVSAIWMMINQTPGQVYSAMIANITGTGGTCTVHSPVTSPGVTLDETGSAIWTRCGFASDVALAAGNEFVVASVRTDGTGASVNPLYYSGPSTEALIWPAAPTGQMYTAKNSWADGDTAPRYPTNAYVLGLAIEWKLAS